MGDNKGLVIGIFFLTAILVSFFFVTGYPIRHELVGEGKLVMIDYLNVVTMESTLTATAGISGQGIRFIGLQDDSSKSIYFYIVGSLPKVLKPNHSYRVWERFSLVGTSLGTFMEEI